MEELLAEYNHLMSEFPRMDTNTANWLAGFIDGDGWFGLHTARSGESIQPRFGIKLRIDDWPVLQWLSDMTGLGTVTTGDRREGDKPGAAPYALWRLSSVRDCAALCDILGPSGCDPDDTVAFSAWFAGFTDAEGCFMLDRVPRGYTRQLMRPRFIIGLRADDVPTLEHIRSTTGVGSLSVHNPKTGHTQMHLAVVGTKTCSVISQFLRRGHLRSKKAKDFAIWDAVIRTFLAAPRGWNINNYDVLEPHKRALEDGRKFDRNRNWAPLLDAGAVDVEQLALAIDESADDSAHGE